MGERTLNYDDRLLEYEQVKTMIVGIELLSKTLDELTDEEREILKNPYDIRNVDVYDKWTKRAFKKMKQERNKKNESQTTEKSTD